MRRRALVGGLVAFVVIAALLAVAVWMDRGGDEDAARPGMTPGDPAAEAADEFAAAWRVGRLAEAPVTAASGDVAAATAEATASLGAPIAVAVTGMERVEGTVTAGLETTWDLGAGRTWTVSSVLPMREEAGGWKVAWTQAVVHPQLQAGDRFEVLRTPATRGEILGLDGTPLVGLREVIYVGLRPADAADPASTARRVASVVGVDAEALVSRVASASPNSVVSVITLRKEQASTAQAQLTGVPGVVLQEGELPLAPTRDFARALIGSVGPATAEIAAASEGRIREGDLVGLSGLQAAQDEALGGAAGLSVRIAPADPNREPVEVKAFPATPGSDVTITIDAAVQEAADDAVASAPGPAALVVIRPSTGDVLAVANGPSGSDGYNRAMIGRYPPGSTFKVASGLAILESGITPDTEISCPATIVVGKEFRNAEGEVLGDVPFRTDFAESCNTAFVGESRDVSAEVLAETAARLGYRDLEVGMPVFGGSVPVTDSETEHAANMIGQGKVEASPFAVALASASVAAGRSVEPRLVVDPADPTPEPGAALPEREIADLRSMMRSVVTAGTGSAVLGIPGGEVSGKTGTAEYGTEDPPRTHAWFTGFQGDLAFAVLVEDGGFGGRTAAPIAATFLSSLAAA